MLGLRRESFEVGEPVVAERRQAVDIEFVASQRAVVGDGLDRLFLFRAPSRLRMLAELLDGERTVEQLAAAGGLSMSATSHNLRILRGLRLVRTRREGRHVFYALHDRHSIEERSPFVCVHTGELRPLKNPFEFSQEERTHHDLDAIIDERAHDEIRRTSPSAEQCGDIDAWVDDDPDHDPARSRRAACTSSTAMRSASSSDSPNLAWTVSSARPSR